MAEGGVKILDPTGLNILIKFLLLMMEMMKH